MTLDDIKNSIQILFNFNIVNETDEKIEFSIISDKTAFLIKKEVEDIIRDLTYLHSEQEIELYDKNSYEVLVRNENRFMLGKEISQKDTINKIDYAIGKPTDKYLVLFIYNLGLQDTPRILRNGIMPHRLKRIYDIDSDQTTIPFENNILEVIKEVIPRLETLQIDSYSPRKKNEFENLVYAFLFTLGYNLDYTFQPLRFMDEFTQPYKIGKLRRNNFSDIEPPKLTYINELILHYQKGISSESIEHQFLSFYHVLEHFFEKIYNDDILLSIKNELLKPNFSYKRTKDISNLVGFIQNRLKYKNEEFQINEPEALELTLKKFVTDLEYLKTELNTISPKLLEHFKTTEVSFSKGNRVNFDSNNLNEIYTNLAKRIYYTRNSIVHSKETEKTKYTPFSDDKDLLNEIYLLRLIAEIVIINNSKEL
ncbi:hypothetical protein [Flavobacterium sp. GT3P67]|uniref:hypothetical protein n=1 Tax=Flavobacterium sp. GT3P67 TaxID=2541722 RepID=UPI0010450F9B|nr:hypothetical protein [Flavobacterium sp. GT3P67]TDE50033.1 hypothetical protein E0H99_13905 [Flavobacterium sp. GT3P67]